MAVSVTARGRDVGRSMLANAEAFAHAHGFTQLYLSTTPFLSSAIHRYELFGFRRNAAGPHDLFGTALFTMTKSHHV